MEPNENSVFLFQSETHVHKTKFNIQAYEFLASANKEQKNEGTV